MYHVSMIFCSIQDCKFHVTKWWLKELGTCLPGLPMGNASKLTKISSIGLKILPR